MKKSPAQMAAAGKRSGVFRHVYGDQARPDKQFHGIKNPFTSGDSNYISANDKFIAISRYSGGSIYILPLNNPQTVPLNQPVLAVSRGKIFDHDFHPFIPNIIAAVSEDCRVYVTLFPIDGLTETITKADIEMTGHTKKISLCKFNPCANSILSTASFDKTIKIWNIELAQNILTYKDVKDRIYSMQWNHDGSQLAITGKDKRLRIFDPRQSDEAISTASFQGIRNSNCFWIPNMGWIGCTGHSKAAKRQIKLWDLKKLSEPIHATYVDHLSGVNVPYYDNDIGLLYTYGKGNGSVAWYEIINDAKMLYNIGTYRSPEPQKGGCFIPKRACDVWKCEINRFLKLTKNKIVPVSIIVPRKSGSDVFQSDIFPDVYAGKPVLNSFEWSKNMNCNPQMMSMDPEKWQDNSKYKIPQKYFIFNETNKLIYGYIRSVHNVIVIDAIVHLINSYYSVFLLFAQL
eukprot:182925_1